MIRKIKKWLNHSCYSRTQRFAALMAALSIFELSFGLIQPYVPANVFAILSLVTPMGMAYYRTVTSQPLSDK